MVNYRLEQKIRKSLLKKCFPALPALLLLLPLLRITGCAKPSIDIPRHVVLISIDTCRADHLSCYGYPLIITPNIDAVAEQGFIFQNTITPVPITLPAHSSMLTGTIPPYHGVHDNHDYRLNTDHVTLAEILKNHGFSTAAIISAFVLDARFGLNQGFDYYNDRFENPPGKDIAHNDERRGEETSRFARAWLDEHQNENFFLFLHYFDPHAEYAPPEPYASEYQKNRYAGEIAYTDYCIGQVIDKLKELGIYDSTLLIITSDHGESLGEHGETTHDFFIYQSTLHVPLIFKLPGSTSSHKIKDRVGLVDIVPTVCKILNIDPPPGIQGRDLSGLFLDHPPDPTTQNLYYCESLTPQRYQANSLLGVVTDRFKYIQTSRCELYDLVQNPGETSNLIIAQPQRARILQENLRQILEQTVRQTGSNNKIELDEQARKRLESLGYVAGGDTNENFSFDQSKDDPKDIMDFHLSNTKMYQLIHEKKYAEAEKLCRKMLSERPLYVHPYQKLCQIAELQGNPNQAVAYLRDAIKVNPKDHRVRNQLGVMLTQQDKSDEAFEHFTASLQIKPEQITPHNYLAELLEKQNKLAQAVAHYDKSLQVKNDQADIHTKMANALYQLGQLDEALTHWTTAVSIKPDWYALNNLAWIKAVHENPRFRNPHQALELALQACSLTNYEKPDTLDTLAAAYAATGNFPEAVKTAQNAENLYLSLGQQKEADDLRKRLELYRSGQPYLDNL
jgi:arylsulfatase A-like enzyme/Flp pilus assembly protein TadD